jgi:hypothetical protein
MKVLFVLVSLLFVVNVAQAESPVYVCGSKTVEAIASLDFESGDFEQLPMSQEQRKFLTWEIDGLWNCDEGVQLLGAEPSDSESYLMHYVARCSTDSLGTREVRLPLTCSIEI